MEMRSNEETGGRMTFVTTRTKTDATQQKKMKKKKRKKKVLGCDSFFLFVFPRCSPHTRTSSLASSLFNASKNKRHKKKKEEQEEESGERRKRREDHEDWVR